MPPSVTPLPSLYTIFFLYIEPIATALGAYYAHFRQDDYMHMTWPTAATATATAPVSTGQSIVLTQLANLYFVFALNEALVLRCTTDRRVWNTFLLGLLIADFGHLYSVHALGGQVYYRFWEWNSMYWGNLGFVYIGATMRTAFLSGLALPPATDNNNTKLKS
ncbi:Tryprostatin B 6-hydroxylase [Lecanosticta acicola]|uniref:Tryprostatin B 6-hydroxylase n=1 Tax=Lecanosticta acicola TaxID=111012 RepID=A0AAI8Z2X5_9PEZI|nr:Tryprostatin B 6-hydroxylase [Lecanosticta acicola]